MIDPNARKPVHRQLADLLRDQIISGRMAVGSYLPSEHRLAAEHGISRESVREALSILRYQALIYTRAPYGSRVRADGRREEVAVPQGTEVETRSPDEAEQARLTLDASAPVTEVRIPGQEPVVYDAMSVVIVFDSQPAGEV